MSKGGVLTVTPGKIEVSFSHLLWFKSHGQQAAIKSFWNSQGYAEAESLAYERTQDALVVRRNLIDYGWAIGTGTLEKEVYELPF